MNTDNINIQEDAKADWMKIVKRHKKRQRGLPALSTLNTNAGNVEKNIELFNMMQPDGSVSVDAANGNTSACCEGINEAIKPSNETRTLVFDDLPIDVITYHGRPGGYYDYGDEKWLPDEDIIEELILPKYYYQAPVEEIVDVLLNMDEVVAEIDPDDELEYESELADAIKLRLDDFIAKYYDELSEALIENASRAASAYYAEHEQYAEEVSNSGKQIIKECKLDDVFDMSMRTLL